VPRGGTELLDVVVVSSDPVWGRVALFVLESAGHRVRVFAVAPRRPPRASRDGATDVAVVLIAAERALRMARAVIGAVERPVLLAVDGPRARDAVAADAELCVLTTIEAWDAIDALVETLRHVAKPRLYVV